MRIDTASRKFHYLGADAVLILVIYQEASVFRDWDDAYPAAIFDDVVVRDDRSVGYSYLLATYFEVGGVDDLLVRECFPGVIFWHVVSLVYLFFQFGLRFSRKACRPSWESCVRISWVR